MFSNLFLNILVSPWPLFEDSIYLICVALVQDGFMNPRLIDTAVINGIVWHIVAQCTVVMCIGDSGRNIKSGFNATAFIQKLGFSHVVSFLLRIEQKSSFQINDMYCNGSPESEKDSRAPLLLQCEQCRQRSLSSDAHFTNIFLSQKERILEIFFFYAKYSFTEGKLL